MYDFRFNIVHINNYLLFTNHNTFFDSHMQRCAVARFTSMSWSSCAPRETPTACASSSGWWACERRSFTALSPSCRWGHHWFCSAHPTTGACRKLEYVACNQSYVHVQCSAWVTSSGGQTLISFWLTWLSLSVNNAASGGQNGWVVFGKAEWWLGLHLICRNDFGDNGEFLSQE